LIETGIIKGRKATSYKSIRTDVINAGGAWEDSPVVVDQGIITSRNPGDLDAFPRKSSRKWSKDAIPSAAPPSFRLPRGRWLATPRAAGCHF
jgi:putative intracellular protease/amidase